MQFFCIRNEAIRQTYRALQSLNEQRQGSLRPGRVMRVAQLYGYLQWRSRGKRQVQVTLRDLGAAWLVQPRLLRADLDDLQSLGWLRFRSDANGTTVQLLSDAQGDEITAEDSNPAVEERWENGSDVQPKGRAGDHRPETSTTEPVLMTGGAEPQVMPATRPEPSAEPESTPAHNPLIAQFVATYNQNKPQSWPAYNPTGSALARRLQKAIRHAGGAEAFWAVLIQALRRMPEFWRLTYPQGRSGSDCAMALLSADRKAAGLGVEFWHVFCWGSQGQTAGLSGPYTQRLNGGIGGNTPGVGQKRQAPAFHPDHLRACELLLWDGHEWKGKGMAGRELPASEKQHLAEVLEAAGFGIPGKAAEQFAAEAKR
ncbi:hypothetical protein KJJ24_01785 [Synechococcus sp. LA31]|nr:hypothetical protein KJJ24_01785 [Synechococcus sp. LA31]